MRLDEALAVLASHTEALASCGVASLALLGSVARDEAGPESSVDVLVEFNRPVGLFAFVELKEYLERLLGRRVDLVTRAALKRQLRDRILQQAAATPGPVARRQSR